MRNKIKGLVGPLELAAIVVVVLLIGFVVWRVTSTDANEASDTDTATSDETVVTTEDATTEDTITKYYDGSFVALDPDGGLGGPIGVLELSWTPHKDATIYEVQIRFIGQDAYPETTPADQIVTFAEGETQPEKVTWSQDWPEGDYQWRITAKAVIDGEETVLQSTEDRNLQFFDF